MANSQHINGDLSVGRNMAAGGALNIQGNATIGHNLKVKGWVEAHNIKDINKGVFVSYQELLVHYPTPNDGWLAGVVETITDEVSQETTTQITAYLGIGGQWVKQDFALDVNMDAEQLKRQESNLFVNITNLFELVEEKTLTEILELIDGMEETVAALYKVPGVVLTFLGENGWETWRWDGESLEDWDDESTWVDADAVRLEKFATGEKVNDVGIDSTPTPGSDNLVKSGGVAGYVSVSQNTQTLKIDGAEQGALGGVYADPNPEFIYVLLDSDKKIIVGVHIDGNIYYGDGCPKQIKDYIQAQLDANNISDIVSFLGNLIEGEDLSSLLSEKANTDRMVDLLNSKVDKVAEKSLIDSGYANSVTTKNNAEVIDVETDSEGRMFGGRYSDGTKFEEIGYKTPSVDIDGNKSDTRQTAEDIINTELDTTGKIISYRDSKGVLHEKEIHSDKANVKSLKVHSFEFDSNSQKDVIDAVRNDYVLPSFYFDGDYIINRVTEIQGAILKMGRGDIIGYITDTHPNNEPSVRSGKIFKYIASQTPLQKVIFGGDIGPQVASVYGTTNSHKALSKTIMQQTERLYNPCRDAGCSILIARGNHDFVCTDTAGPTAQGDGWAATRQATRQMTLAYTDTVVTDESNDKANYYYKDNVIQKIRYIILDTSDEYDTYSGMANVVMHISNTQFRWILDNAIMTLPDGYSIVMVGHVPLAEVCYGFPTASSQVWSRNEDNFPQMKNVISSINLKKKIYIDYSDEEVVIYTDGASNIPEGTIEYDFDTQNFKVIAYLCGHQHCDLQTYEDDCCYYCSAADWFSGNPNAAPVESQLLNVYLHPKIADTIYEDLLNVIVLDLENNKMRVFRIGSGLDRIFNLNKVQITENGTETLVSELSSPLKWYSYDATEFKDNATLTDWFKHSVTSVNNNGVVTSLTTGQSVVLAYSENDKCIEFFNVEVQ